MQNVESGSVYSNFTFGALDSVGRLAGAAPGRGAEIIENRTNARIAKLLAG